MLNAQIKADPERPIWDQALTEEQRKMYPKLPGYQYTIDMPSYLECIRSASNGVDDNAKQDDTVIFTILEEIGKFPKLWSSACPGKEHAMWPIVGFHIYRRLGRILSLATIKYIFAQSRAKMRRRLTFMIKSHTGISIENLEDKMWCFPEYRVLRYYRYQTKDLETRLRRDQLTDKAGKPIEIYLDDEDEAFDVENYVEPVEEVQVLEQHGEPVGRDDDSSSVENRTPPRAQNGQDGHSPTIPSRKRRPVEDVFNQSGPLLPPNFAQNPRSAPAWNFQQRPGPSNSQANCQPTTQNQVNNWSQQRAFYSQQTSQNQQNSRQQNPMNLPPMNRPPPGYVPAVQQNPQAPPAPQQRSQLHQHISPQQREQLREQLQQMTPLQVI
ncbi:hypothetical protein B9Z55_007906 [Caenorhabditis nigoni]|uniref:Uncharacterized protein n=1 Tax=Caenorhabditis nigoni TaxID=1611254 RepID=A0A2G5VCF5_9PELO|nr:hypothetical protein B9Z55_007906 [Caenorhabditis nigoni]